LLQLRRTVVRATTVIDAGKATRASVPDFEAILAAAGIDLEQSGQGD
jgi:hypothetical protein